MDIRSISNLKNSTKYNLASKKLNASNITVGLIKNTEEVREIAKCNLETMEGMTRIIAKRRLKK